LFDSLIQGLQHSGIYRGDHIHRRIELFFGHPCFPCVRKAPVHSRIAKAHHRYGQTHEHFLTFGQAFDGMGVTIECAKVGSLHGRITPSLKPRPAKPVPFVPIVPSVPMVEVDEY
jgi:hypothetical protein